MTDAGELLVELGRALYERRITPGRTGNLSHRVPGGFVVTPTGVSLGRLRVDELATVDLDGNHVAGPKPSKEWPLHLAWYLRDDGIGGVAHVHSVHAVAVSLLTDTPAQQAIAPLTAYFAMRVGRLPLLPYRAPGDADLARLTAELPEGMRCALLANHGSIAAADDVEAAVDAVEEIEETARLHLLTRGQDIHALSATEQDRLSRRR